MKTEKEIKDFFEKVEAIQNGHFILSSGKRSKIYCQCSKLFEDPRNGEMVCEELKHRVQENIDDEIDYVISPALGGLLVGYELARSLGSKFIFYERVDNEFELRRGFNIKENANVLFVEDVITTGKSTNECLEKLKPLNVNLLGIAAIVDRSNQKLFKDHNVISVLKLDIPIYDPNNLPDDLNKIPATICTFLCSSEAQSTLVSTASKDFPSPTSMQLNASIHNRNTGKYAIAVNKMTNFETDAFTLCAL